MEQNSSHSSFAIMAGKFGKRNSKNVSPKMNNANRGSTESTRQLVKPKKSDISKPVELDLWGADKEAVVAQRAVESPEQAGQQPQPQRSSGWSRYFAPTDSQLPSAYAANMPKSNNNAPRYHDETSDAYVPPLDFTRGNDKERLSRVVTGSPAFNNSAEDLARRGSSIDAARGQRAQISGSRLAHGHDDDPSEDGDYSQTNSTRTYSTASDRYSSSTYNVDSSSASAWTPVSQGTHHQVKPTIIHPTATSPNLHAPRPPSSNYTNSVYDTKSRVFSRGNGNSGFFLSGKQEFARPNSRKSPTPGLLQPSSSAENILSNGGVKNGLDIPTRPEDRDSTMTVFPRGVPSAYYADRNAYEQQQVAGMDAGEGKRAKPISDMSWLRLDEGNRI